VVCPEFMPLGAYFVNTFSNLDLGIWFFFFFFFPLWLHGPLGLALASLFRVS
jgi:hypothetical protein